MLRHNDDVYEHYAVSVSLSSDTLDVLSGKLQSIQDIDELTKMVSIKKRKSLNVS